MVPAGLRTFRITGLDMLNLQYLKLASIFVFCTLAIGCADKATSTEKERLSVSSDVISIENRNCNRITAILPGRGRYDGISLMFDRESEKLWSLSFDHVSHRNEKPSEIGLLTLDEIVQISQLILNKDACGFLGYDGRRFKSGDEFILRVDLWLVEDFYRLGVDNTRDFSQNMEGELMKKPLKYPQMNEAFALAGYANKICDDMSETGYPCSVGSCLEYNTPEACEGKWLSSVRPYYSPILWGHPMKEMCNIENCGLEKESSFSLSLMKQ